MQEHAALYEDLPAAGKVEFDARAASAAEGKQRELQEDIAHLEARVAMYRERTEAERQLHSGRNLVDTFRLNDTDMGALCDLYMSDKYTPAFVRTALASLQEAPMAPPDVVMDALEEHEPPKGRTQPVHPWLRPLCDHRESMRGVAFCTRFEEGTLLTCFSSR